MSAGAFTNTFYQTDTAEVVNARVQPETITAWNPAAGGPAGFPIRANMSTSRRNGVNARVVYGKWTTAPTGYLAGGRVRVPILTITAYNAIGNGDSLAYAGGTFEVTGKRGEKVV